MGVKTTVTTAFQVFLIDSFYGITRTMREIPFDALTYDKAKRNIVEYIIFREIIIQLGREILFMSMMFFVGFIMAFIFGGGSSLFYLLF